MKTSYIVGGVVAIVIIGALVWFWGQSPNSSPTQTSPQNTTNSVSVDTQTTAPVPSVTPPASATPQPVSVAISNFAFNPSQVSVKVGTVVSWTNHDSMAHTVTSNNGAFNSGTLNPGSTFSFTFNTPGTFSYHCAVHPSMTATVVVTQ